MYKITLHVSFWCGSVFDTLIWHIVFNTLLNNESEQGSDWLFTHLKTHTSLTCTLVIPTWISHLFQTLMPRITLWHLVSQMCQRSFLGAYSRLKNKWRDEPILKLVAIGKALLIMRGTIVLLNPHKNLLAILIAEVFNSAVPARCSFCGILTAVNLTFIHSFMYVLFWPMVCVSRIGQADYTIV